MAPRILTFILYVTVFIPLNSILHVYGKECLIMREKKRDKINTNVNRTLCMPSNNPCAKFDGILDLTESQCICICPPNKPTYMETTKKCSTYGQVWLKCNLSFRRHLAAIPIFSMDFSSSLRLNLPKNLRRCKMGADRNNSFYLSGSGWKLLPQEKEFPFLVDTKTFRKRLKLVYVKWKTKVPPELVGKVFRLGIICGKRNDCVTLKISGKSIDQCILPPTTMLPATPSSSSLIPLINITTQQKLIPSQPSASNNDSRESKSMKISWYIIGTVIGIIVALLLCIIILVVCFWRKRKRSLKKSRLQNSNASTQNSGVTISSSESQPEVTYASPHHPYQELKPPISGTPRGTYQPLKRNAKEDSSGYMLPLEPTTNNYHDPLYNEIGSPKRPLPPVYDYALPEHAVRFSNHLSNIELRLNDDTRNGSDYVGRTTRDQEEPTGPSAIGVASAPSNDDPAYPSYLDFPSEPSECRTPGTSNDKKPVNVPKCPNKKSSPEERTYQVLDSPGTSVFQPLRLSIENLYDKCNKESTA